MLKTQLVKLGCKGLKIGSKAMQTATTATTVEVIMNQEIDKDKIVLSKSILKRKILGAMAGTIAAEVVDMIIDSMTDSQIIKFVAHNVTQVGITMFVEKKLKELDERKTKDELEAVKKELADLKAKQNKED